MFAMHSVINKYAIQLTTCIQKETKYKLYCTSDPKTDLYINRDAGPLPQVYNPLIHHVHQSPTTCIDLSHTWLTYNCLYYQDCHSFPHPCFLDCLIIYVTRIVIRSYTHQSLHFPLLPLLPSSATLSSPCLHSHVICSALFV